MSVGIISANEISVNDTYVAQDSSENLLAVDEGGVGSNSSNILSIDNVDTNLDENTIGDGESSKGETKIKAPDITLYYKNGTRFIAQLVDEEENGLINQSLIFTISGVSYNRTTDVFGYASMAINLIPGDYYVNVFYAGSEYFLPTEALATCTVLPTISGEDITKYYKNDTQYYATFLKGDGTPLANTNVTFNINGVFYSRPTDSNGVARLNINLPPNDYRLTAIHPDTGYMYSNNITVLPTILSEDLVKVYKDNNQYYATFLNGDGTPLANTNVTFNINGVFYTRSTNGSGVARLNINLPKGEYILTAYHPNDTYRLSNDIIVIDSSDTALEAKDRTFNMDDKQNINVTLYNELAYVVPDQTVALTIDGNLYYATTDANGMAVFNTKLNPGTYVAKFTYDGNGPYKSSKVSCTIKVKEGKIVYYTLGNTTMYYGKKETFDLTLCDEFYKPLVNQTVYFKIGDKGKTYERITDENGTASLAIKMNPGVYTMNYVFNGTGYQHISDSCELLVINESTSKLAGENTTIGYGSGERFYVLLNVGDIALPDRNVIFTINGVNYTRTTDKDGIASIAINLLPGQYPIKYYYLGEDKIDPSSGEAYITVKERIATSLHWDASTVFVDESNINLLVSLLDKDNKPIENKKVVFTIGTKIFESTTDASGLATVNVALSKGKYLVSYEFEGDNDYLPCVGYTEISVSESYSYNGYGYWSFGADMYNIDLAELARLGTTDILLNFYAFTLYGESNVLSWIQNANSYGIRTHIWMQVFYSGGSWVNPVSGGSVNQAYFNSVINEAAYYAGLNGVAGVHFDYLRYPGDAYKTSGGTAAITEFVRQACEVCKKVNPNIIMSAAVMPETTDNIYYYGQDIPAIGQYLDVIIPMQYKGNYNAGTNWLASTTNWFVKNSNGAKVWSGLQSYVSDDNPTKLTYTELFGDAQTVLDNGADGVISFRFGLSQYLNFNDLEGSSYGEDVSVKDVLAGAKELKDYIEDCWTLPAKVAVGTSYYSVPQVLYLMSQALLMIDGDIENSTIVSRKVSEPSNELFKDIYGELTLNNYIDVCKSLAAYCISNEQAPGSLSSSLGDINYKALVYAYSRILSYYYANNKLPANVLLTNFLNNPNLTVNMMPSSTHAGEYKYQNYTTTWLNYCPQCGYYGTLLNNPKHVSPEGELTCHFCDCDYCGVTGYEKDWGSDLRLTNLTIPSPLTPGGDGDSISISNIVNGASYLASYYLDNLDYPDYVVLPEGKYTITQFFFLMSKAIVQINDGNFNPITMVKMDDPSTSGDVIDGDLTKADYVDVLNRAANFIINNEVVPAYSRSPLGNIAYVELVDMSSRILDYYASHDALPNSIHVVYKGQSSRTISELAQSLVKGLTSDKAKATALYNYVRDDIAYEFYYDTQKGAEGTLASGGGNCCDQAQLLVAMARAVGLTARFDTGYCYFNLAGTWYGHVWAQFLIDGTWYNADPTSNRNSFGVIVNWDTSSYTDRGTYDVLPY
jgi:hypothetical protein